MAKLNVKKGDKVKVIAGKSLGKEGVVLRALPKENRVVVEGVAVAKKSQRPTAANSRGGIVDVEQAIDASNVMLICPSCSKPSRVGHKIKEDGSKVRVCKKCGAEF
ncbi:MAG: 50S ribosomal protein L24 [Coriobacteriia bacterium]|nr:50S ribosomal protein L24 [Coriobacteriia bacterium]